MPKLANPKHEAFAELVAQGVSQIDAYEQAGYKRVDANASRMISDDKIQSRIAELRAKSSAKAEITLDWLMQQGKEILVAAKSDGSHAASVAALKELGILSGERVEKRDNTNRSVREIEDVTTEELLALISSSSGEGAVEAEAGAGQSSSVH